MGNCKSALAALPTTAPAALPTTAPPAPVDSGFTLFSGHREEDPEYEAREAARRARVRAARLAREEAARLAAVSV